ncbi:MAG: hypothetical protein ACTSSG_08715 [Candidatus Heimdallarchaeaceae archaeon]
MGYFTANKDFIFKILLSFFTFSTIFFMVLTSIAIYYYPGGNIVDHAQEGFSFLYNTLCDLGGGTAVNGEPNHISQILFNIASVVVAIGVLIYFSLLWTFFRREKKTIRVLSTIASVFGIIQGILYIAITFTRGRVHMTILIIAPLLEFFAIIMYTIVFMKDSRFPKLNSYSFLILSIIAISYSIIVIIANALGGNFRFIVRRAGHTTFNYIVATGYFLQGLGLYFYIQNNVKIKNSSSSNNPG